MLVRSFTQQFSFGWLFQVYSSFLFLLCVCIDAVLVPLFNCYSSLQQVQLFFLPSRPVWMNSYSERSSVPSASELLSSEILCRCFLLTLTTSLSPGSSITDCAGRLPSGFILWPPGFKLRGVDCAPPSVPCAFEDLSLWFCEMFWFSVHLGALPCLWLWSGG